MQSYLSYMGKLVFLLTFSGTTMLHAATFQSNIPDNIHRPWVGPDYWANRLQDWQIQNGRIECIRAAQNKLMRTLHLLTHRVTEDEGELNISVDLGTIGECNPDSAAGILVGAGANVDYRAAALVHHGWGPDAGIFIGLAANGQVFIRDYTEQHVFIANPAGETKSWQDATLSINIKPGNGHYDITVNTESDGEQLTQPLTSAIPANCLVGNIALVSHPGEGGRFWFDNWKVSGSKLAHFEDRNCGPILSTQYTLDHQILKLTAQFLPIGVNDTQNALLQIKNNGSWHTVDQTAIISPGYTAPFRVESWDDTKDVEYRLLYELKTGNNQTETYTRSGTIRHDPVNKESIVVAGFTGNHNTRRGVERGNFPWNEYGLWFPHNDIVNHVWNHNPDLLFFSGDQVYEGGSPTGADRQHAELDYLYKWYLWCWAFRDLTADIPTVTIPDDHDVFQPNLWGAGGPPVPKDDHGGFVMPPEWVNMVQRTQTSHLPDPYDPTPVEQDISVYYTDLTWGRVGFAILEDRKFKTGPRGLFPFIDGRPDHVTDPAIDVSELDHPGLKLLGVRQLEFLDEWSQDWRGQDMKSALSQTIFGNMATHHGGNLEYLEADLDSNGWPQSGRARALHKLRQGFAFMIGGDQHLATLVHHGIDTWDDAGWSMCVPSIANFYPRAWDPPQDPVKAFENMPDYTGQYYDGLGNPVTLWAATNPKPMGVEPAALHDRMPGYGIVRFNKTSREITAECWPRFEDPTAPNAQQYEGWPKTISQLDNYGREALEYLPTIQVTGMMNPVLQIRNERTNEVVYTLRIKGTRFRPKVFEKGDYTVIIGNQESGNIQVIEGVKSLSPDRQTELNIEF